MRNIYKTSFILLFLTIIIGILSFSTLENSLEKEKSEIVKNIIQANQSRLDTVNQLVVVYNNLPADTNAVLFTLEKIKNKWIIKNKPLEIFIGRNGFAPPDEKWEGDGKSPTGLFRLGQLFSYLSNVKTQLPFIQVTAEDKWIDDPESAEYNTYIRGKTNAKSFEKLLLRSDAYKYCVVIEYNTHPVVKGKGSAIFLHLGKEASSGCVVMSEKEMKKILRWLSPQKNPCILMGNKAVLMGRL